MAVSGFWSPTLPISAAGGGTPSPSIVQHVASSANPIGVGISLNNFAFYLPNAVGAGNCLVLGITYPNGSTPTVTDNNGNTWPGSPTVSADAGAGANVSAIFVLSNANAGVTKITVTFGGNIIPFQYTISEVTNVATSAVVNGSKGAANVGTTSHATGSFTPTNNNANGGNLIWNYVCVAGAASGNPSTWSAGGSFTLLDGDISWTDNAGVPHASQWFVQTTAASINPAMTSTGDTQGYNCLAVALKAANAGTPQPAGIHIDKIIHQTSPAIPASLVLQEPTTGNLRVVNASATVITGITSSDGGTWTQVADGGGQSATIWYSVNRPANSALKITITATGGAPQSIRFYDISGAAASPVDVTAHTAGVAGIVTTLNDQPDITPTTSNGLVIAGMELGQGPGLGFNTGAPAGAVFDLVNSPPSQTDQDLMDNADLLAHYYNPNTTALTWNWLFTDNSPGNSSGGAVAIAFKKA